MKQILYLCIATSIFVTAGCSFDTSKPYTSQPKQQTENAPSKEARQKGKQISQKTVARIMK
ncbi:hypothetical protein P4485_29990 [Bacillus thuringiensis]|nr:hypothetical protein [Bacillus thuringiensis]